MLPQRVAAEPHEHCDSNGVHARSARSIPQKRLEVHLPTHPHLPPLPQGTAADQSRRGRVLDESKRSEFALVGGGVGGDDRECYEVEHMIFHIFVVIIR